MSIGAMLLQPDKFRRAANTGPIYGLVADVFNLVIGIAADRMKGGDIFKILEDTVKDAADRMASHFQGKIENAWKRLQDCLKPLTKSAAGFARDFPGSGDAAGGVEFFLKLLTELAEKAGNLSVDNLRQPIEEFLDIFQKELGLTGDFIQKQVWAVLDDLAARLEQGNRRRMALSIRRLKQHLHEEFTFPGFNADQLAGDLLDLLRRYGAETVTKKTSCYADKGGKIFSAANALAKLVPYAGFGSNTVGAAEASPDKGKEYLWYPTWLLGKKVPYIFNDIIMLPYPGKEYFIDNEKKKLICRNFFFSEETLNDVNDNKWWETDPLNKYTFNKISAEKMEEVARHSGYIGDFTETLLHGLSIEHGDWLSNVLFGGIKAANGICNAAVKTPLPSLVRFFSHFAIYFIFGSLLGLHTKAKFLDRVVHWLSFVLPNAVEAYLYHSLSHGLRDALLSVLTLYNHEKSGSDGNHPQNYKAVDGVVKLITKTLTLGLAGTARHVQTKKNYGIFGFKKKTLSTLCWWLGGSLCTTLVGASIGTLISQCIAWDYNKDIWDVWGEQIGKSIVDPIVYYWMFYYLFEEGNTRKGKYNPAAAAQFAGYPDHTDSPYKLPFRKGKRVRCSQGNQGFISHNNFGFSQVYAYDFDLDKDEEILASREGTVVDYFDWIPDDTEPDRAEMTTAHLAALASGFLVTNQTDWTDWNFIVIRHDTTNNVHDKDENGNVATTYCIYGHGRQGSVRRVFNRRTPPVPPGSIIGTRVNQGDVIILAGDTGTSAYNHLHMQVQTRTAAPTSPPAPPPTGPAVGLYTLDSWTIPFVFKDAKHGDLYNVFRQDGVPKFMNWYKSDNGEVTTSP